MRAAGVRTVIVQWTETDGERLYPVRHSGADPLRAILHAAASRGMEVFLGTHFLSEWWRRWNDPAFHEVAAERNATLCRKLAARYGQLPAWRGWYLPFEIGGWDPDDTETVALSRWLARLARDCRRARPGKVLASAFFTRALPAPALGQVMGAIFRKSGVDAVLLQTGVGARSWEAQVRDIVPLYFSAVARALGGAGPALWAVVETFREVPGTGRVPAEAASVTQQIAAVSEHAERVLIFDFFHYVSPHRGDAQAVLHRALFPAGAR